MRDLGSRAGERLVGECFAGGCFAGVRFGLGWKGGTGVKIPMPPASYFPMRPASYFTLSLTVFASDPAAVADPSKVTFTV